MKHFGQSGQALLIAVLVFVVLLVSLPSVIFFNRMSGHAGTSLIKSQKALAVAQEGLAYAIRRLSDTELVWTQALDGTGFPAEFGPVATPTKFPGSTGGVFTIRCYRAEPALQIYQIRVVVQGSASAAQPNSHDDRAIEAVLSRKTVAVVLPNQYQTAVAFQFSKPINVTNAADDIKVDVHWGPMALFDSNSAAATPWNLGHTIQHAIDFGRYPRKFSTGPIDGVNTMVHPYPRTANAETDHKEYWSNTSLGFPSVINLAWYQNQAQLTFVAPPPICSPDPSKCVATPAPLNGYFGSVGTNTARFVPGYGSTAGFPTNAVIYINGNALLDTCVLNIPDGAFIVDGDLTLNSPGAGANWTMRVPPNAQREYPYPPGDTTWPCRGLTSCTVAAAGAAAAEIRGFLYVTGNLIVAGAGWTINGVVRVDKEVQMGAGSTLTIFYDDIMNRNIKTANIALLIDSQKVVPAK